jgi:geranylgeranyl diphosphate synthase type I
MHDLKTGSYTTRGPAELGGILADADEVGMRSLRRWAAPLGVAFQLRDDLLGTFGNVQQTGKPGDDLRHGKHNAVVAAFGRLGPSESDRAVLEGAWGRRDATDDEVLAATKVLAGAKSEVVTRLRFLADEARSALAASPFDEEAQQLLEEVTQRLTDRGT